MNWVNSISIAVIFSMLIACNSTEEYKQQFLQQSSNEWTPYFSEIAITVPDMTDHVFLISHSTTCTPCLNELSWWNREGTKIKNLGITLIVLERHKSVFKDFLEANNLDIPAYRDSSSVIFKHKLIPLPPIKLYFNNAAEIVAIENIGTNGNLATFMDKIEESRAAINER